MTLNRACRLTGNGKSAVAVISVRGPDVPERLAMCFRPAQEADFDTGQVRFGQWYGDSPGKASNGSEQPGIRVAGESIVVTPMGDNTFELHCHGGDAAVERILDDLAAIGVETVDVQTWTESPGEQLTGEALNVMRRCLTARTAALVHSQIVVKDSTTAPTRMIDWVNRWIEATEQPEYSSRASEQIRAEASSILASADWTTRLDAPFRVVLSGPPNVGKSTLVNAIVGYQRSITFDQPGTTRDLLHAETVLDGFAVRLTDTAGLRDIGTESVADAGPPDGAPQTADDIERDGIGQVAGAAEDADLVVKVQDHTSIEERRFDLAGRRCLWVQNKSDLIGRQQNENSSGGSPDRPLRTVATTGDGINRFCEEMVARLTTPKPAHRLPIAVTLRQKIALQRVAETSSSPEIGDRLRDLRGGNGPS